MQHFLRSIILSILASVVGTYFLRRLVLAVEGVPESDGEGGGPNNANVNVNVVVMPIVIGNTSGFGPPGAIAMLKRAQGKLRG